MYIKLLIQVWILFKSSTTQPSTDSAFICWYRELLRRRGGWEQAGAECGAPQGTGEQAPAGPSLPATGPQAHPHPPAVPRQQQPGLPLSRGGTVLHFNNKNTSSIRIRVLSFICVNTNWKVPKTYSQYIMSSLLVSLTSARFFFYIKLGMLLFLVS